MKYIIFIIIALTSCSLFNNKPSVNHIPPLDNCECSIENYANFKSDWTSDSSIYLRDKHIDYIVKCNCLKGMQKDSLLKIFGAPEHAENFYFTEYAFDSTFTHYNGCYLQLVFDSNNLLHSTNIFCH